MSKSKKDQLFPTAQQAISDDDLAKIVSAALRHDFGEKSSAVKQIGKLTNVNLRAIKNWYEARNTPSSGHLLLLARSSPSILKFILLQIGGDDLYDAFQLFSENASVEETEEEISVFSSVKPVENVPLNVSLKELSGRQQWFLILLDNKNKANAEDISKHFNVTIKTARRDIEGLKSSGKICFIGAKKTGRYKAICD